MPGHLSLNALSPQIYKKIRYFQQKQRIFLF
nr:MAG TPA: hypothetical protein [Caudoviricetes sp.]